MIKFVGQTAFFLLVMIISVSRLVSVPFLLEQNSFIDFSIEVWSTNGSNWKLTEYGAPCALGDQHWAIRFVGRRIT